MASRVKRAATSATRPEPFVITTNWMTTRIRKTTRPTSTLPPTTNAPNAWITPPASPCSRISRVTLTLIASRNSVVSSSSDGKAAKSSARGTYIVVIRMTRADPMLTVISRSSSGAGSGTSIITTTSTTASAASRSVCLSRVFSPPDTG